MGDAAPAPPPAGLPTGSAVWTHRPATNCWEGNGAEGIAGKSPIPSSRSLSACKAECEAHPTCEAITVPSGPDPHTCFLRKKVQFAQCRSYDAYDTWGVSYVTPTTSSSTTPPPHHIKQH